MYRSRILRAGVLAATFVLGGAGVATAAPEGVAGGQAAQDVESFSGTAGGPVIAHALALAEANARGPPRTRDTKTPRAKSGPGRSERRLPGARPHSSPR